MVDEGRASRCATAATGFNALLTMKFVWILNLDNLEQSPNPIAGLVTLQGSAPRVMAVTVAMLGDLFATDVTG